MPWLELTLATVPQQVEALEDALLTAGAVTLTLSDAGDAPVLEPAPGEVRLWPETRLTGLFDGGVAAVAVEASLREQLGTALPPFEWRRVDDRDWVRCWLDDFRPLRFGRRLWIEPSGHQVDRTQEPDAVVVSLDPGLAFGTGTHPTTALCLELLDAEPPRDAAVLDYGCGSGVLGIAALKLGARSVTAVDIDPQALTATGTNALRNEVAERITLAEVDAAGPGARYELVLANILAGPLCELAPLLAGALAPGGRMLLSGILAEQSEEVVAAYRDAGLTPGERREREGWVALTFTAEEQG